GNPPTPTSPKVKSKLLSVLPPIGPGKVYELGSGWGGLALSLARVFPENEVVGIERSPLPWLTAMIRGWALGPANLDFKRSDFLKHGLEDAALVLCYLQPAAMARLHPKLEAELAPGATVLSHTFRVPGWQAAETYEAGDIYRTPIYIYWVP
ncbi:MAG: class I SAM-dependent methyltransferase, partial [Rhodospirillales bacterium]|nr:class I SAM-dependent methyltransferase [Rhodospirillales bacterium]